MRANTYFQQNLFLDIPSAEMGITSGSIINSSLPVTFLFRNVGIFAQDTWRIVHRLTMTYGLRWDADLVPSSIRGPSFNAVTGFDLSNLSNLALLPRGTPPYKTRWGNIAPRIGLAYQVSEGQGRQTVLRGGFGVFYDLASSEAGNGAGTGVFSSTTYPFGSSTSTSANFPLSPAAAAPAPIALPNASNGQALFGVNPSLELPYTLQWNVAVEQELGRQQTFTVSYIGAAGKRLIQTSAIVFPNPNLFLAQLVTNAGTSDYSALQLQFQRRLARGLQALASYSWSHSLDTASAGSVGNTSNALSTLNSKINRGSSDFDVRNAFSMALTYNVPAPMGNAFAKAILRGWSTENIIQARSAPPVDVVYGNFPLLSTLFFTHPRPDVVAGQPLYLHGRQYPGGRAFNPAAFTTPPLDPVTGFPAQGNLARNALRGFGAAQWDFAVHREFVLHESLKLQFRAELFNVLNHPSFGPPIGDLSDPRFGQSTQMLGRSLAGSGFLGGGAFDPLYQLGGPRSIQFGLKLSF
jgi:TonB dependent receptor